MLLVFTQEFNLGSKGINLGNKVTYQHGESKYFGVVRLWIIFVGMCVFVFYFVLCLC